MPSKCSDCGLAPGEHASFSWHNETAKRRGSWRGTCDNCEKKQKRHNTMAAYAKNAMDPTRQFKTVKASAGRRGISVAEGDAEAMLCKMQQPCHYCDFVASAACLHLNGLDRTDPRLGYSDANTKPCCATCNIMKSSLQADEFVHAVRNVATYSGVGAAVLGAASPRIRLPLVWHRRVGGPPKEKKDLLTREQKIVLVSAFKVDLWASNCYLCGRCPALGIDRLDSSGDYTPINARPCCTTCNMMKNAWSLEDFLAHMTYIQAHTRTWTLSDVGDVPLMVIGNIRVPVRVTVDGEDIIFPSGYTLHTVSGLPSKGWTEVPTREYREQQTRWSLERAAWSAQSGAGRCCVVLCVVRVQPSPAQPSPAQPSPAQPSPAQPSPAQPSPAQPWGIGHRQQGKVLSSPVGVCESVQPLARDNSNT
ncbi:hypothetical protein V8C86DRAFT_2435349 [Haematococcus lacustris]